MEKMKAAVNGSAARATDWVLTSASERVKTLHFIMPQLH